MTQYYALTVLDLRDGTTLLSPHWQSTWPALADLSAIRASRPSWPDAMAPDDASALLRAKIALRHLDGSAVLRQGWFGFLCKSGEKIVWRELDDEESPRIIIIHADSSSFCVWT